MWGWLLVQRINSHVFFTEMPCHWIACFKLHLSFQVPMRSGWFGKRSTSGRRRRVSGLARSPRTPPYLILILSSRLVAKMGECFIHVMSFRNKRNLCWIIKETRVLFSTKCWVFPLLSGNFFCRKATIGKQ